MLLLLLLGAGASAQNPPKTILDFRQELQLSDAQVARMGEVLKHFQQGMDKGKQDLLVQERDFQKEVASQAPLEQVKKTLDQIAATRITLRMLDVETERQLSAALSEEQRSRWKKIQAAQPR